MGDTHMGFGRGILFWLLGVPIPIIILLALLWHH
jgi:Na+/melibiose symporter-like transporter